MLTELPPLPEPHIKGSAAYYDSNWTSVPEVPDTFSTEQVTSYGRDCQAAATAEARALVVGMVAAMELGLAEIKATGWNEGVLFGDDFDVKSKMEGAIATARAFLGEAKTDG